MAVDRATFCGPIWQSRRRSFVFRVLSGIQVLGGLWEAVGFRMGGGFANGEVFNICSRLGV